MTQRRTKLLIQSLLLVGTIVSLFFVPWLIVKAWILPLPDSVQAQAEEALDHGFEGVVVYVDQAGKPPAFYTAGWHDSIRKIPARPDALFKIASINKLYTAVTVAKLVHAGRLNLDKTVADYFPELASRIEYADQITLRMLIQHRSGIPNYTDSPNFWANPVGDFHDLLNLVVDQPANFKPGKDYEYCNTNYLLAGELINRELGYPQFLFIQEAILDRLNLKHTFNSVNDVDIDLVMSGYHMGYPHDLKTDDLGIVATAEDVGIFLRALNDGSLFDDGEQDIYSSIYENEHSGWVPGYQSFAEYHEDTDAVVVVFYNTTDSKLYLWNVSEIVNGRIAKIIQKTTTP